MPLPTEFFDKLTRFLASAFDKNELRQLAVLKLAFDDVKFEEKINFDKNLSDIAFQIGQIAEHFGHLEDLIRAIVAARPSRTEALELQTLYLRAKSGVQPPDQQLRGQIGTVGPADTAGQRPPLPDLHDAIIRFNAGFQQRQEQFRYLNAYKQLHDLLHKIQDFQPQVESVAAAIRRPDDDRPDPTTVTDPLGDWLKEAQASAQATEFPALALRWVAKLEKSVKDLTQEMNKPDPASIETPLLDRAVEILAHLPADEQKRLNEELVMCAMRLKTDEVIASIDRLLAGLGALGSGDDDLRGNFQVFRSLCQQLAALIRDHNLCQEIQGAIREAEGLTEVTPGKLSQWPGIKAGLLEIATLRPGDLRANRPVESARLFEEAAAAGNRKGTMNSFRRLNERFDDLFYHTDEALLEVTRALLSSVQLLDATLKRYI